MCGKDSWKKTPTPSSQASSYVNSLGESSNKGAVAGGTTGFTRGACTRRDRFEPVTVTVRGEDFENQGIVSYQAHNSNSCSHEWITSLCLPNGLFVGGASPKCDYGGKQASDDGQ